MQAKGLPDTPDEARENVSKTATINDHSPIPAHWPHSQIVSLAVLVTSLAERVDDLERKLNDKPRRGRPPKDHLADAEVHRMRVETAA